jgi:spore coat polysaccharide biosynthesis protein SpsF (cytidylyltransferase family)
MSSTRLQGKVLAEINGVPVLTHCITRCQVANVGNVVIATSESVDDEPIALLGSRLGVRVFRGSLDNVIERFRSLTDELEAEAIVRISGDSPFINPVIIQTAAALRHERTSDLVTNVLRRTLPKGQSVEIVSRDALERVSRMKLSNFEKEHV